MGKQSVLHSNVEVKATGVLRVVPICGLAAFPIYLGRPEWSKVQTRGKPLVATAQAKYMSAGEQ